MRKKLNNSKISGKYTKTYPLIIKWPVPNNFLSFIISLMCQDFVVLLPVKLGLHIMAVNEFVTLFVVYLDLLNIITFHKIQRTKQKTNPTLDH